MENSAVTGRAGAHSEGPFGAGAVVLVSLSNPRDKFWGAVLSLSLEGLSVCGIELASFDDVVAMVKDGEPFSPGIVFFPMHRIERIDLDLGDGEVPSTAQRFAAKTGLNASTALTRHLGAAHREQL